MTAKRNCERVMRQRQRGRRILAWLAGLFFLAQLAGGLILDYVWIGPRNPFKARMLTELHASPVPHEILFLGSSRFGSNINCVVLDGQLRSDLGEQAPRSFNASVPAGDPTVYLSILEEILQEGRRPQLLVVEISPETLSYRDNWLPDHALNLLDWRDVPEAIPALLRNGKIMNLVRGRLLPLHVHRYRVCKAARELVRSLLRPAPAPAAPMPNLVFTPSVPDLEPPPFTPAQKALLEDGYEVCRHDLKDYRPGGLSAHRLERLLDRCRSSGIAVLLVGVPVASPYRRAYTPEVETAFLHYVRALTDRFGCSFVDWRDRLPDKYFADARHAYPEGGVYFSRRLAAAVLAPLWRDHQLNNSFVSTR